MTQRSRSDSPTKFCTIDGCGRPLRAKGYCSSHYNRLTFSKQQRHPKVGLPCSVCGTSVMRYSDSRYRPTCSVNCRTIVQYGRIVATSSAYQWRVDARTRALRNGCDVIEDFDRMQVFERDEWTCQLCGDACNEPDPYDLKAATVDHVIAYVNGGQHTLENAQTACLSCNSSKAADDVSRAA